MRRLQRVLRSLILLLLFLPATAPSQEPDREAIIRAWELSQGGQERILSFVSAVAVQSDGDLDVTETIRIVSLAQEIQHGIQRDFPTSYTNKFGQRTRVGFQVLSVQRDGKDEPWERISLSNGVGTRIGSADLMLPVGEHVYVIRYRTTRQIFYGEKSDELYWNVTGNGWTFPIDMAEARITLPSAVGFIDRKYYTGLQGSTAQDAIVVEERPGFIAIRTTKLLDKEHGLTIAVTFPKGVLVAPGQAQKLRWWLQDWGALTAGLIGLAALAIYYFRAWAKAGRGPRAGTVVPIFAPPDDLTPAAARYISKMKFDDRAFTAAIVDLGVHCRLHIDQEKGGWLTSGTTTLSRTDIGRSGEKLPGPEAAMFQSLFSGGETIELKQANHTRLQSARTALQTRLKTAYSGTMFQENREWALWGMVAIPVAMMLAAMVAVAADPSSGPIMQLWIPLAAFGLLAVALGLRWWAKGKEGCLMWLAWAGAAIAIGLAGFLTVGTIGAAVGNGGWGALLPLAILPFAISAFWWMFAPTKDGRAVMDRIAGFRQYLGITEEDRLEALHPPEKTPELFERYLPYAIALDVENRWANRFAGVLAAAAAAGATTHAAGWYSGSNNFWDNPGDFASTVGSSLTGTVSSASTSPSSSSSSGGGSSGGGGGGGGGSGW